MMRQWIGVATMACALAVWAIGAAHSPFGSTSRAGNRRYLQTEAKQVERDRVEEGRLAAAYWKANPDVKADKHYGPNGPFGLLGAREHYQKFGRGEGRAWPR